jgi:hypothetical protein
MFGMPKRRHILRGPFFVKKVEFNRFVKEKSALIRENLWIKNYLKR